MKWRPGLVLGYYQTWRMSGKHRKEALATIRRARARQAPRIETEKTGQPG